MELLSGIIQRRVLAAAKNSIRGLKLCYQHEEAFRVEVFLFVVLLPLAGILASTAVEFVLMVSTLMLVLIVEVLNSAVEAAIDRIGLERHDLSGLAKDLGSAAVMLSMLLVAVTWVILILN